MRINSAKELEVYKKAYQLGMEILSPISYLLSPISYLLTPVHTWPMSGSKIPPIGPLRYLLFKI
jgi:hypothetical protein